MMRNPKMILAGARGALTKGTSMRSEGGLAPFVPIKKNEILERGRGRFLD